MIFMKVMYLRDLLILLTSISSKNQFYHNATFIYLRDNVYMIIPIREYLCSMAKTITN